MDYGRLNRRELQALCKEHGIPANKTNVFMAEALGALLNAPKEIENTVEIIPDPAEVVKANANLKRAARSKKAVEPALEASAVDDLSSEFAKSTLDAGPKDVIDMYTLLDAASIHTEQAVNLVVNMNELPREAEVVAEPAKVPRKTRTQLAKEKTKSLSSLHDVAPALVEPTLELVLPTENTVDPLIPATVDSILEVRRSARRVPKVVEEERCATDSFELGSDILESGMPSDEDTLPTPLSPVAEIVEEGTVGSATSKKFKVRRKKSKKVKPGSPTDVNILEDGILLPTINNTSCTAFQMPESPTLGLTSDVITAQQTGKAASISPVPGDEAFEFHPVPESFAEIMTPGKAVVEATKGCHHRVSRRGGKDCKSCVSNKKVAGLMQEVLQAIEVPTVEVLPVVKEVEDTEVHTTPVKESDDKENALKNIDLHSLSIRKLQKEVKRGLSKRNNTKVKV